MISETSFQRPDSVLKVLVVGATGGTGRAAVEQLLTDGHQVTAFSRQACERLTPTGKLNCINGDVMNSSAIDAVVQGHDVVIVTLGISENPFRVRLLGTSGTASDVRSQGTRNVIAAMRKHGVKRLVVQSSYGVGETREMLRFADRLFFSLILKPQIDDTEIQEQIVRSSGVDWVIVQPVHLVDSDHVESDPFISATGESRAMKVARSAVARFLATAVWDSSYTGKSVSVSG
jgi:uncharacterized protein YbjT (DUF2867 family)